jgi:hypothetical protein
MLPVNPLALDNGRTRSRERRRFRGGFSAVPKAG